MLRSPARKRAKDDGKAHPEKMAFWQDDFIPLHLPADPQGKYDEGKIQMDLLNAEFVQPYIDIDVGLIKKAHLSKNRPVKKSPNPPNNAG